ncbi:MAG: 4-hydroxy-3-methylbut-2-enyl diphosphate reductase [Haloplasmataceae bacterium]|jgi:4-hydroxy-3-methylbut-2-enyl diphosphate reductase|nr:4-hydroxy-3-methylbut-2-enyl diphosphate reductase [Haloplasmataceae bacterium]
MNVIKITPRGFCSGVVNALKIAVDAAQDQTLPKPIYVLGNIVHNHFISEALNDLGLITIDDKKKTRIELLDLIESGTVILTAHGVSKQVIEKAKAKNLYLINATCKYVDKTNDYIAKKIEQGFDVIYIGKKNHPEPESAVGVDPNRVHLVENMDDIRHLYLKNPKIAITNQTTMSYWDIEAIAKEILTIYPQSEFMNEICNATQIRQEGVLKKAINADLTIVVGDPFSNNSNKLVQISESMANTKSHLIENVEGIKMEWLKDCETVAVTSGASTPTAITSEVIDFLEKFDYNDQATHMTISKLTNKDILGSLVKKI